VKEGADYQGALSKALLTRDSQGAVLDYGRDPAGAQLRVVSFDHAGHLWPQMERHYQHFQGYNEWGVKEWS